MDEAIDILDTVEHMLARLSTMRFSLVDDEVLVALTMRAQAVSRRVDAIQVFTAAEIEERSRRDLGDAGLSRRYGYQRASHLVEQVARVSAADALRWIRLGSHVAPRMTLARRPLHPLFPSVSEALADGRIGADAAGHIVRALGRPRHWCCEPPRVRTNRSAWSTSWCG